MNENLKKGIATGAAVLALGGGAVVGIDNAIDPYIDEGSHHKLEMVSDFPQGERVEIHKDKAQMDLIGWNDEYKISIKPQIPIKEIQDLNKDFTTESDRNLFSKKLEYKAGDITAFIKPKEETQNEFDIDFTLESKPETNVFEYKIEGADDFDFFYQFPLTKEDIEEGRTRPENVEGSYAVYHKTKKNAREGATNYGTGKVFHIYRPEAIDADNNRIWAELFYNEGVLKVVVPQDFLDKAVYPVIVDPTFGYTGIGATADSVGLDQFQGTTYAAPATSNVDHVVVYGGCSDGACNWKGLAIASSTKNLLTNGTGSATAVTGNTWNGLGFTTAPAITSGTNYIFGAIADENFTVWEDVSTTGFVRVYDTANSYATPANLGATSDNWTVKPSIYMYYYGTSFSVETYDTETVDGTSVTMNGKVYLNEQSGIDTFFVYGTAPSTYTATTTFVYKNATTTFSGVVSGLEPLTTYYYRAGGQASSSALAYGDIEYSFNSGTTTTTTYVGTNNSDIGFCYQAGTAACFTGVSNPNSNARMGFRTGVNFGSITTGFRFVNVTIPQGADILSAYFYYTALDTDSTSPPTVKIFAEDIDDSPTFATTGADSPDTVDFGGSRATTTASVSWTLSNQTVNNIYKSPNIQTVVQEVVDRAGWTNGNDLSIILGPEDFVDNFNSKNATSSAYIIINYSVVDTRYKQVIPREYKQVIPSGYKVIIQ